MPKYIDAYKLLKEAKQLSGSYTGDGWDNWGVYALIERQPAADVEPVIQCRDCKNSFMCDPGGIRCTKILNNGKYMPVEGDFFCAYSAKMDAEPTKEG